MACIGGLGNGFRELGAGRVCYQLDPCHPMHIALLLCIDPMPYYCRVIGPRLGASLVRVLVCCRGCQGVRRGVGGQGGGAV